MIVLDISISNQKAETSQENKPHFQKSEHAAILCTMKREDQFFWMISWIVNWFSISDNIDWDCKHLDAYIEGQENSSCNKIIGVSKQEKSFFKYFFLRLKSDKLNVLSPPYSCISIKATN